LFCYFYLSYYSSAKTPSRDAPPADTPNIHPPSSERSGKLKDEK